MPSTPDVSDVVTHFVAQAKRSTVHFLANLLDAEMEVHERGSNDEYDLGSRGQLNPLQRWFLDNLSHPYPPLAVKRQFSRELGLSLRNIDRRFTNWRRRTRWSDIKRKWAGGTKEGMVTLLAGCDSGVEQRPEVIEAVRGIHLHFENDHVGRWIEKIGHVMSPNTPPTPSLVFSSRSVSGSSWSSEDLSPTPLPRTSTKRKRPSEDVLSLDQTGTEVPRPIRRRRVTPPLKSDVVPFMAHSSPSLESGHLTHMESQSKMTAALQLPADLVVPGPPVKSTGPVENTSDFLNNIEVASHRDMSQVWAGPLCSSLLDSGSFDFFNTPCNWELLLTSVNDVLPLATSSPREEDRLIEFDWFSLSPHGATHTVDEAEDRCRSSTPDTRSAGL